MKLQRLFLLVLSTVLACFPTAHAGNTKSFWTEASTSNITTTVNAVNYDTSATVTITAVFYDTHGAALGNATQALAPNARWNFTTSNVGNDTLAGLLQSNGTGSVWIKSGTSTQNFGAYATVYLTTSISGFNFSLASGTDNADGDVGTTYTIAAASNVSTVSSQSDAEAAAKAASAAAFSSSGTTITTGMSGNLSANKPLTDVGDALQSVSWNTSTKTLTFDSETATDSMGVVVSGTMTFDSSSTLVPGSGSGGTVTLSLVSSSLTASFANKSVNLTTPAGYFSLVFDGSMTMTASGTVAFLVTGQQASSVTYDMTVSAASASGFTITDSGFSATLTPSDLTMTATGTTSVGSGPTLACSGGMAYSITVTGAQQPYSSTGSCTMSSDCTTCS